MVKDIYQKEKEINQLKAENSKLPNEVFDWMMANCLDKNLDRNLRYVNYAF